MATTNTNVAAIDVGSNAIRLAIGSAHDGKICGIIETIRHPVRLGKDVFSKTAIGEETTERTIELFTQFRAILDNYGVSDVRAVGTSALREAENRDIFIERIEQATGIEIEIIGGEEEARLIHLAVAEQIDLKDKRAMLIDIGGGSVELTLVSNDGVISTESFKMGAVRLLQELEEKRRGEKQFNQLVREYVDATRKRVKKELGSQRIDICVATGGNVEAIGDLNRELLGKKDSVVTVDDLEKLSKKLQDMTYEERVHDLRLRPDRADVIVPASIVLQRLVKLAGVGEVLIPHVGLKDGVLLDIAQQLSKVARESHRDQVLGTVTQVGRKFGFDEQHATTVLKFAVQLFDATRGIHKLEDEHRMLLEAAALLHEVGNFISATEHHKHSHYLITHTPLIGLTESQRAIVANVARYHRKSFPTLRHEPYRALATKNRVAVSKLAALLRLADALDNEHDAKVSAIHIELNKHQMLLRLEGDGDLLLEKWALTRKTDLFKEVFGLKVTVSD